MGVFLIYHKNNKKLIDLNEIDLIFKKKGLKKIVKINTGDYSIHIGKNLRKSKDSYINNDYDIYSFGTFIYKSKSKNNSLKVFLNDFLKGIVDESSVYGIFQLLIINKLDGTYEIINDKSDIFDLYTVRGLDKIISNSFLTLYRSINYTFSIDKKSLAQNVFLGYIIGQGTLIKEIKKLSKNNIYHTNSGFSNKIKSYNELKELLNRVYKNISISFDKESFDIGLSGGYDSRLNLVLGKDKMELSSHTHIKKGDKRDYNISKILAEKCKIELKTEESKFVDEIDSSDIKRLLDDSFYFYDGRVSLNTGFLNDIYTRKYREKLVENCTVSLSGFGGEIFRNYNNLTNKPINIDNWLHHFVINPFKLRAITSKENQNKFIQTLKQLLIEDNYLDDNIKEIGFDQMYDYYHKIWIKHVLSLKIFAENQLLYYLMPLIDYKIVSQSSFIKEKVKRNNFFEAELIKSLDKELSEIPSSYGYSFSKIPIKARLKNRFVTAKLYLRIKELLYSEKRYDNLIKDKFILNLIDSAINELDFEVNKKVLLSNKTWALNIASIGYILKDIKNSNE